MVKIDGVACGLNDPHTPTPSSWFHPLRLSFTTTRLTTHTLSSSLHIHSNGSANYIQSTHKQRKPPRIFRGNDSISSRGVSFCSQIILSF
ncbi:hypothetical protein L2E82_25636 [Cichorium intybus]|uniref:Uncharacterized protein n=1 Tax=Cichorium intybus TaxID=13427 RepID=A0ACB9E3M6_CICIN|nr:hypothetical protein L2E82_25636 [Cichorium intybus]